MATLLLRVSLVATCFHFLVGSLCAYGSDDVVLDADAPSIRITQDTTLLADPQHKYSAAAILRGDLDHQFHKPGSRSLPVNGAWFKFTLRNETNATLHRVLTYESPMIREARLYKTPVLEIEKAQMGSTGALNLFTIELNSFAIETYYLFLDTPIADYSITIEEPLYHVQNIVYQTQTSHLFYGASLGIFLYSIILLVATRLPVYLWFSSSVLAYTLTWSTRDGSALTFLPELNGDIRNSLPWIFLNLSCIAFAKFFSEFLSLKSQWPTANNLVNTFIAIWVGILPLDLFVQTNLIVEILAMVSFAFIVLQISILVPLALQRQRDAIFYFGGYSVTIVVFAFICLAHLGVIALGGSALLNLMESVGPHMGQLTWMIVMTFALGGRFRELSDKEEEATRESQSKSSFLATMSHEIRTPMNGVLGMTELLSNTRMNAQQKNYVATIHSSASALLTILDDILDYSKIQSGKLELERIPINLYRFVADTVPVFAAISRDKQVPLLVNIDEELPAEIWADPTRIRQIFVNLLGNAFKFTADGYIAVNLYRRNNDLVISIRDTGIGISAEDQSHVFSTFSQADKSTNRKFGGSGLGLSICKDLLAVMGGHITVTSELGVGSDFIVGIPIDNPGERTFLDNIPSEVRRLTVLLFEPVEAKRNSIMQTMHGWGIQIRSTTTIEEARHIIESGANIHAVLTSMPATLEALWCQFGAADKPKLIELAQVSSAREKSSNVDFVLEEPISPGNLLVALETLFCDPKMHPEVVEPHQLSPRISDLKVLVAEDNEINQRVIRGLLKKLGVEPIIANNGKEAFRYYYDRQSGDNPFDLILMDCEMPQVDGYEATQLIRQHEQENGKHVDIVALTANVLPEHRKKAADMGMDEFLTKPIRLADLQQLLSNL